MGLDWEFLGDSAENVLSWLDEKQLARMEASFKGVTDEITKSCWDALATLELDVFTSRPWLLQKLPDSSSGSGKNTLKELIELRVSLNTVPAGWSPRIRALSQCSLQVSPLVAACAQSTDSQMPPQAAVPLALGITVGDEMTVGLQIQSEAQSATEDVWLSVEFVGICNGWGECVSVQCAPMTGRCKIAVTGELAHSMVTQAMPPLADDCCDSVEVYVTVSESGGVEFFRISNADDSIVRSGSIPRNMLPRWTTKQETQIFAAIEVDSANASAETKVSAKKPASNLHQEFQKLPESAFDGVWTLQE